MFANNEPGSKGLLMWNMRFRVEARENEDSLPVWTVAAN